MTASRAERGHAELLRRIGAAGSRWRRRAAAAGAFRTLAFAVPALAGLIVTEAVALLPPAVRVAWLGAVVVGAVWAAAAFVVRPALRRLDAVRIAAEVEAGHPELGELLESAAELWEKRGATRLGYSVELIDALVESAVGESAGIDFTRAGSDFGIVRWGRILGAAAAASAIALALTGARLGPAVGRLAAPFAVDAAPGIVIEVEPGDTTLVSGDDLSVTARVRRPDAAPGVPGAALPPPVLRFEFEGEAPGEKPMTRAGDGSFRAALGDVRTPLRYAVAVGDETSRRFSVEVTERPFVAGIRLDYEFPRYSGLLARTVDENNGDITALAGTRVTVTVTASKALDRAELVFGTGARQKLERAERDAFRTTVTVTENATYSVEITDRDGLSNPDPASWSIVAVRDEYPLVRIVEPGEDRTAPSDMVLPVAVSAVDDYGVSRLLIRYSIEGMADEGTLALVDGGAGGQRELVREALWDLTETGAVPGSMLIYFAEVTDNDAVSGPKVARSESYLVRFPSVAEMYSRVTEEQDSIAGQLEDLLDEQAGVREQFDDLKEEMKSDPSLDWQKEERVEAALERQEKVADEVGDVSYRLDELTGEMSETDRVTLDALEKTEEIARLLDEVATDEMRELLQKIRDAMADIKPEQLATAMEQMTVTQDDYLRRLEQTLNLLRRAKAEQELADVANRAEDLAEREGRVAEEASQNPDRARSEALAGEQAALKEEVERLKADLAKAAEDMGKVDEPTAAEMQSAASEMEQAGTVAKMEQGRAQLADSKPTEAAAACQSASNDLKALFTRVSSCQGGMASSIQQRDREATLRAVDELLGVSVEQEKVVEAVETRERIPRSRIVELVAKQADLVEAMAAVATRLFTVSKDSFVIDPALYRAIGGVQAYMTRAASKIAAGGSAPGGKEARDALGSVNSLVVTLLTSNQTNSPSAGGSALQQLMQQLQALSEQQSSLNDMTQELQRQTEELGMGQQVSRQLAEMKAGQERLLEDARRLAQEFGDRREILGRLDDTVDEMEKTVAEMERSGASQGTVDRQKRILSRLLDSQRSLRRRDYTRERLSRVGEEYGRGRPGALSEDVTRATQELREDLLRAMESAYPSEYRDLIRAYFEGLSQDAGAGVGQ
jgi:hypothetical protein